MTWAPPEAPLQRRSYTGLIVGGSIVAFLVLVGAVIAGAFLIINAVFPPPPAVESIIDGDPGSPIAVAPVECPEVCFDANALALTIPDDESFTEAGVPTVIDSWGDYSSVTVANSYSDTKTSWQDEGAAPDSCFFVYYGTPVVNELGAPPTSPDEVIEFTGTHGDERNISYISQSVRLFGTSDSAVEHMVTLADSVAGCPSYSTVPVDGSITVAPAAALSVPDSVAAVGWVEEWEGGRFYAFDLQKANMVVRTFAYTDGGLTEQEFRTLVTDVARTLGPANPYQGYGVAVGCEQVCASVEQVQTLSPNAEELAVVGPGFQADPSFDSTVRPTQDFWNEASSTYRDGGGSPRICYFATSDAPLGRDSPAYNGDLGTVPLGRYTDATGTVMTQAAQVSVSQLLANRYVGSLRSPILQCASYSFNDGTGVREVTLEQKEFATGSSAVDSAAWVETWDDHRRTVVNLSYDNVTMRLTLDQTSASTVSDEAFAEYVKAVAAKMQGMN